MAMHSSEDVGRATTVLFKEMLNLGIETLRCGIVIINENQTMNLWGTSSSIGDVAVNLTGTVDLTIHPMLRQLFSDWKAGKDIFTYELKGKDAERYYQTVQKVPEYGLQKIDKIVDRHFGTGFLFEEGALFAFTKEPFTSEAAAIFRKFTNVFILTYRRYLDLKKGRSS